MQDQMAHAPDPWLKLGWLARIALLAAGTFPAIGLFSMGAALPAIEKGFAGTPNVSLAVQIVIGLVAPAFALASPLAGRLVGRYGVRSVYLVSLVLFVIGGLGPMICTSLWAMIPFRLILALGVAGAATAGYAGVARVPAQQRQILLGMMAFVGGGITIFAYPIVGNLAAQSWQLSFLVHLIVVPLALTGIALPGHRKAEPAEHGAHAPSAGILAGVPLTLLIVAIIGGWGMVASSIYSPVYLGSIGVSDPARIGSILAVMSFCSLAGSGSYGFVHRLFGTKGMVLLGLALCGTACAVIASNATVTGVTIGLALLGAGLSTYSAAAYAAAIEAIGPQGDSGSAMGVMNFALFGPGILFPPLAMAIGKASSPSMVYYLMAGLFLFSIVLILARRQAQATAMPAH